MPRSKKPEYFTKSINIPKDLKEKLEKEAENQNRDLNNMIITILKSYFNK